MGAVSLKVSGSASSHDGWDAVVIQVVVFYSNVKKEREIFRNFYILLKNTPSLVPTYTQQSSIHAQTHLCQPIYIAVISSEEDIQVLSVLQNQSLYTCLFPPQQAPLLKILLPSRLE